MRFFSELKNHQRNPSVARQKMTFLRSWDGQFSGGRKGLRTKHEEVKDLSLHSFSVQFCSRNWKRQPGIRWVRGHTLVQNNKDSICSLILIHIHIKCFLRVFLYWEIFFIICLVSRIPSFVQRISHHNCEYFILLLFQLCFNKLRRIFDFTRN